MRRSPSTSAGCRSNSSTGANISTTMTAPGQRLSRSAPTPRHARPRPRPRPRLPACGRPVHAPAFGSERHLGGGPAPTTKRSPQPLWQARLTCATPANGSTPTSRSGTLRIAPASALAWREPRTPTMRRYPLCHLIRQPRDLGWSDALPQHPLVDRRVARLRIRPVARVGVRRCARLLYLAPARHRTIARATEESSAR
jgi:hypothetical protein